MKKKIFQIIVAITLVAYFILGAPQPAQAAPQPNCDSSGASYVSGTIVDYIIGKGWGPFKCQDSEWIKIGEDSSPATPPEQNNPPAPQPSPTQSAPAETVIVGYNRQCVFWLFKCWKWEEVPVYGTIGNPPAPESQPVYSEALPGNSEAWLELDQGNQESLPEEFTEAGSEILCQEFGSAIYIDGESEYVLCKNGMNVIFSGTVVLLSLATPLPDEYAAAAKAGYDASAFGATITKIGYVRTIATGQATEVLFVVSGLAFAEGAMTLANLDQAQASRLSNAIEGPMEIYAIIDSIEQVGKGYEPYTLVKGHSSADHNLGTPETETAYDAVKDAHTNSGGKFPNNKWACFKTILIGGAVQFAMVVFDSRSPHGAYLYWWNESTLEWGAYSKRVDSINTMVQTVNNGGTLKPGKNGQSRNFVDCSTLTPPWAMP